MTKNKPKRINTHIKKTYYFLLRIQNSTWFQILFGLSLLALLKQTEILNTSSTYFYNSSLLIMVKEWKGYQMTHFQRLPGENHQSCVLTKLVVTKSQTNISHHRQLKAIISIPTQKIKSIVKKLLLYYAAISSMNFARVMSRTDTPPQSCVFKVTCTLL